MRIFTILLFFFQLVNSYAQDKFPQAVSASFHTQARQKLLDSLSIGDLAFVFSNPEKVMSNDTYYPFFQNRNLLYLSGFHQANSVLVVFKNQKKSEQLLFIKKPDPSIEKWNGKMITNKEVEKQLNISCFYLTDFKEKTSGLLKKTQRILWNVDTNTVAFTSANRAGWSRDRAINFVHDQLKQKGQRSNKDKFDFLLAQIRAIKTTEEIELLQEAISITCKAQEQVNLKLDELSTENEVEAEVEYVFRKNGAEAPGFPSIIGSGPNSCVLHYIENQRKFEEGEMLVVDIGARVKGYTADVTRTFSTSSFNTEQQAIYDLVEKAQTESIEAAKAGVSFRKTYKVAVDVIAKGLIDLGIIEKESDYQRYFFHGVSHYLGLNVHDIGPFDVLREGNVITVEPGIYVAKGSPCEEKWWNIGVRLEDDILITKSVNRILSACLRNH